MLSARQSNIEKKLVKPEVDFEPNRGEIVFRIFLPKKAVLAETNYSLFLTRTYLWAKYKRNQFFDLCH